MSRLNRTSALIIGCLFMCPPAFGQTPVGFHWVNFKTETTAVQKVERALKDEAYSAIREIGLTDTFALVLTVQRETGQVTFDGDVWRVYSVSTTTGSIQTLLVGFNLQVKDWIKFQAHFARSGCGLHGLLGMRASDRIYGSAL